MCSQGTRRENTVEVQRGSSRPAVPRRCVSQSDSPRRRQGELAWLINARQARFRCDYPACEAKCCSSSRPTLEAAELARVLGNLHKFLPLLRQRARDVIGAAGITTRRRKHNCASVAVVDGRCLFYNEGCVLHKVGASEGDRWRYKPWRCITFLLTTCGDGEWYVRQWGPHGERWDVGCLGPRRTRERAAPHLSAEIAFVEELISGREAWRKPRFDR